MQVMEEQKSQPTNGDVTQRLATAEYYDHPQARKDKKEEVLPKPRN